MTGSKKFPGKILLFGEYTVLFGGRALAVPAQNWTGGFEHSDGPADETLQSWVDYLHAQKIWPSGDLEQFGAEVQEGLRFASSIPAGYGLGSSGALCAAAYARYRPDVGKHDLAGIREELARMEEFFHGTSSGMDPLVSLLQRPVLRESENYTPLRLPDRAPDAPRIFLVDSGVERTTTECVALFRQKAEDPSFNDTVVLPLATLAHHCIETFVEGEWGLFWDYLTGLSALQRDRLEAFIPGEVQALWDALSGQEICLKLCGAGGGGMFLGFARTAESLEMARTIDGYTEVGEVLG